MEIVAARKTPGESKREVLMKESGFKKLSYKIKKMEDLRDLLKGLSGERFLLLKAIKDQAPNSIYQLATFVNKSQPYVQKEIKYLEDLGLITLRKSKSDGRTKMVPTISYSILNIEISF
jgi:predicted transcriptional regulator